LLPQKNYSARSTPEVVLKMRSVEKNELTLKTTSKNRDSPL